MTKSGFIKGGTMLKRILTQKRYFKNIYKEQKGITGLETAIILIAFVVVAAVFAYTVLSAGLFSTQKSQEAVYSGLQETQNTLEVKGGVLSQADPKFKDSCDAVATFTAGTDGTITHETSIIHEGTASVNVTGVGTPAVDALLARSTAGTLTVATGDTVTFWAKLSNGSDGSKIGFAMNTATGGLKTSATTKIAISATDTNWHLYSVDINSADAGTVYYGLFALAIGFATDSVYIDDIEVNNVSLWQSTKSWTPYASYIKLTLSLASSGTPIDFSPGNTSSNGIWTGTKTNKMVINYNDAYSHITDVVWSGTFIGNNNGDNMLDPGEKIQVTVDLTAPNTANGGAYKVDANHQFTLECKTPKGAILSLQRTLPARLYGIDNLY
jgi:flagellin-like protein